MLAGHHASHTALTCCTCIPTSSLRFLPALATRHQRSLCAAPPALVFRMLPPYLRVCGTCILARWQHSSTRRDASCATLYCPTQPWQFPQNQYWVRMPQVLNRHQVGLLSMTRLGACPSMAPSPMHRQCLQELHVWCEHLEAPVTHGFGQQAAAMLEAYNRLWRVLNSMACVKQIHTAMTRSQPPLQASNLLSAEYSGGALPYLHLS